MNLSRWIVVSVVAALASISVAGANESVDLASAAPADTLLFICRDGGKGLADAVEKTSFGKLLAVPEIRDLLDYGWQKLDEEISSKSKGSEEDKEQYEEVKKLLAMLERMPVAIALHDIVLNKKREGVARCALIVSAGDDLEPFTASFRTLLKSSDAPDPKAVKGLGIKAWRITGEVPGGLYFGNYKGCFILAIGKTAISEFKNCLDGKLPSLSGNKQFVAARAKIGGAAETRAWTAHLNIERGLQRLRRVIPSKDSEGFAKSFHNAITAAEALGLGGVATLTWERHYKDGGVLGSVYVASREGVKNENPVFPGDALDRDDLMVIPETATWAFAMRINLHAAFDTIIGAIEVADEELGQNALSGVDDLSKAAGFDLRADFIDLMHGTIVMYAEGTGLGQMGSAAFLLKTPDAEKLQVRFRDLAGKMSEAAGKKNVKLSQMKHEGVEIDTVAIRQMPIPIVPCWTAHKGRLIVGLAPQAVTSAINRLNMKNPGSTALVNSKRFTKYCAHAGEIGCGFSYADLNASIGEVYPLANMGIQMVAAQAGANGSKIPPLPPFDSISEHIYPEVTVSRVDEEGSLTASYGPLPISVNFTSPTSITTVAMATSILLPSLSRARELSKRTVCAANLRAIGQGMYIHAQDDAFFPKNFQILIDEENTTPKMFVCPSSTCEVGDLECCYVYIPGFGTVDDPRNVLIYEKEGAHQGEGCNVLFQDCHVEFVKPYSRVEKLVKETKARLARKKDAPDDSSDEEESTIDEEESDEE